MIQRAKADLSEVRDLLPEVVARQVDVLPAKRRKVLQQALIDVISAVSQNADCAVKIYRVPQSDGRSHEVQAAGSVALLLDAAVTQLAKTAEKHGSGQGVTCLTLIQTNVHLAAQRGVLQPSEHKERALNAPKLAQGESQAVLSGVAAQLPHDERGGDCAFFDGGSKAQDLVPVATDTADVQLFAQKRLQRRIGQARCVVQAHVIQIADARCEPKSKQVRHSEDMIREAPCVGVMLFDVEIGLMVQQPIEHMS